MVLWYPPARLQPSQTGYRPHTSNATLDAYINAQIDQLKNAGTYRNHLPEVTGQGAAIDGRREINLASNNYLGLTVHL